MPSKQLFRSTRRIAHFLTVVLLFCGLAVSSAQAQVSVAWTTRFGAKGLLAQPVAMASDAQGNVYVTATVFITGSSFHNEALTLKYDPNGHIVWKNWLGSFAHAALARALALDAEGNVYVLAAVGESTDSQGSPANSEFATIKYNSNGTREWVKYLPPPSGGNNFPSRIAVGAEGTVYVAGTTSPASKTNAQVLTAKYATIGDLLWSRVSPLPAAGFNSPSGLGLDATENVYVAVLSTHFNPTIYKFDSSGKLLGSFVNKDLDDFDVFHVDSLGNIFAAGCFAPGPVAIKIDPNGNEVWKHPFTPSRCFSGIEVDGHGDVVLAETISTQRGASEEFAVAKLDVNGNLQWESIVGVGHSGVLAVDSTDQVYVTSDLDAAFKYSAAGQQLWSQAYSDGGNFVFTRAATLAVGNRFIITAASTKPDGSETDIITLALSQP